MKNMIKTTGVTLGVLALLAAAGYYFIVQNSSSGGEITKVADTIDKREGKEAKAEKVGTEEDDAADMQEIRIQINLHQMTHQKIIASKKKGAVEMTTENIEDLLTIVKANKDHYDHGDFYETALTAWKQGDFSNAVHVHNTIWDWHNGTVGRATGLMSAKQEQAFVEKHFR
ncbi:DUF6241 domain-containing protein [Planococcus sp. ISL-110]|uniref:DUF6241 domain-containing protein n=1 Tax=Planococcus sp. ISL-110 TaxID=2819167 RepID=UPI001BEC9E70|nr:DUF6241 domain-containing protein [Planococcus sp. ISL-110]MBT2571302.1 hypothetical protein [Planococcus sp. ISL-110]